MNRLLQSWVTQHAETRPDATAVVFGSENLSYGQLERSSNQLARVLLEAGCKNGDRVCILMPKSSAAILSMIGILKAGCMHVPIDASSPAARIRQILESCENRWVLAAGSVAPLLDELLTDDELRSRISVGWLDAQVPAFKHSPAQIWMLRHRAPYRSNARRKTGRTFFSLQVPRACPRAW